MEPLPRGISLRIVKRCARNEVVVIVPREGKPARVFELTKYLKMKAEPLRTSPWRHRRIKAIPDPLGSVDGRVLSALRREDMYES